MKININQLPVEGLTLEDKIDPSALDLDTDTIKFRQPLEVTAEVSRITNAISIGLTLTGLMHLNCSRCLSDYQVAFEKRLKLNYQADNLEPAIDLNPVIREEIILDYPIRPLCSPECKGLCSKCGKNLKEGKCAC